MYETQREPSNETGGSISGGGYVDCSIGSDSANYVGGSLYDPYGHTWRPRPRKKVTVTEYVYDEKGNIVKETITETETEDYSWGTGITQPGITPPYSVTYNSYVTDTASA
jgi:hypothetical protein